MKLLFQKIKDGFKKVKNAVKKEPLEFIASCTPTIMCVLSIITGLILWIVFIFKGGYSEQISLIKSGDFMGAFTYGNVKILYNPIGYINIALSVISVLTTIIIFIKKEKLVKRIIFIVDMVISIVSMSLVTSVIMYDSWLQDNDRKKYEEWSLKLYEFGKEKVTNIMSGLTIAALVGLILLVVLMVTSIEVDDYIKYLIIIALISFGVIPLVLIILENIIPGVIGIVVTAIIVFVIYFAADGALTPESTYVPMSNEMKRREKEEYEYLMSDVDLSVGELDFEKKRKLEQLRYAQEQYKKYKSKEKVYNEEAQRDYDSAINGGTFLISSGDMMKNAGKNATRAASAKEDADYYKEDIIRIKQELGIK